MPEASVVAVRGDVFFGQRLTITYRESSRRKK